MPRKKLLLLGTKTTFVALRSPPDDLEFHDVFFFHLNRLLDQLLGVLTGQRFREIIPLSLFAPNLFEEGQFLCRFDSLGHGAQT